MGVSREKERKAAFRRKNKKTLNFFCLFLIRSRITEIESCDELYSGPGL